MLEKSVAHRCLSETRAENDVVSKSHMFLSVSCFAISREKQDCLPIVLTMMYISWHCFLFSACPLCTRLGLQGHLNTTLTTLKDAQDTADTVANLEELWPELIDVEGLIRDAQVRFFVRKVAKSKQDSPIKMMRLLIVSYWGGGGGDLLTGTA